MGALDEEVDGDDTAPDLETEFDFPALVSSLHSSWQVLRGTVPPFIELATAVAQLQALLPEYVRSTADDALVDRVVAVNEALARVTVSASIAGHCHKQMASDFRTLSNGMYANDAITRAAYQAGFGTS